MAFDRFQPPTDDKPPQCCEECPTGVEKCVYPCGLLRKALAESADAHREKPNMNNGIFVRNVGSGSEVFYHGKVILSSPDDVETICKAFNNPIYPKAGDLVRATAGDSDVRAGDLGLIEGYLNEEDEHVRVCFNFDAYVGASSPTFTQDPETGKFREERGRVIVECSGGPVWYIHGDDLKQTDRREEHRAWHWRDAPRVGGGVSYTRVARVWELDATLRGK